MKCLLVVFLIVVLFNVTKSQNPAVNARENGLTKVDLDNEYKAEIDDDSFTERKVLAAPSCNKIYLDKFRRSDLVNSRNIYEYDPSIPISSNNPKLLSIKLPYNADGLTISNILGENGGGLTFYTTVNQFFWYYDFDLSSWKNTGFNIGHQYAVNLASGGGYIYGIVGVGGIIYRFDGLSNSIKVINIPDFLGPYDLIADCEGNFYILIDSDATKVFRKYDFSGSLLQTWSFSNSIGWIFGGGLGVISNTIFSEYRLNNQSNIPLETHIVEGKLIGGQLDVNQKTIALPQYPYDYFIGDMATCSRVIISLPLISIQSNSLNICEGESVLLTSSLENEGDSPQFQWLKNGQPILGAISSNYSYSPSNGDIITCRLISSNYCSLGTQITSNPVTIKVSANVQPSFIIANEFCLNSTPPQLPATSSNGVIGQWSPNIINTSINGSTLYSFTPNGNQCADGFSLTITIVSEIKPEFSDLVVCHGELPPNLNPISVNGITGTWAPSQISTSVLGSSKYLFTPSLNSCAIPTEITVMVSDPIIPDFQLLDTICLNSAAPTLESSSLNAIIGVWEPPSIVTSMAGKFDYKFTPAPGQCAATATLEILIIEDDLDIILEPLNSVCLNASPITLKSNVGGGKWSGVGVVGNSFDPKLAGLGDHKITYEIIKGDCVFSSSFNVLVSNDDCDNITITNVITPNGDNINDVLKFNSKEIINNSEIWIYNRWGDRIYHSKNYDNNWNAKGYPGGEYFYVFKVDEITYKSNLTVVK